MGGAESITPLQNALDSLQRVAQELEQDAEDGIRLKGALAWAWHAVGLLAYLRLQPEADMFDAWVQAYLHEGEPNLVVDRDARWEERERLSFLELVDLLSEELLPILKPEFYQGWQDRTSRCRDLRRKVNSVIGASISATDREQLLLLLAAYHRLIRLPAGVSMETAPVLKAFPALVGLAEMLLDRSAPEADTVFKTLQHCRSALSAKDK